MADLADQAPSDSIYTHSSSPRRRSYTSQNSGSGSLRAISTGQRTRQLRAVSSALSAGSLAESETDQSEIHSPVPRRHYIPTYQPSFLLQTESRQWPKAPPISPASSRPASPLSAVSISNASTGTFSSSSGRARRRQALSFSSLLERDPTAALVRQRRPSTAPGKDIIKSEVDEDESANVGAGRRWIKWMHRNRMRDQVLLCSVAVALWIKWCVGLGGYSGVGTPPMYGDYEAQRHWMELTNHLPTRQWYTYDLQYWGLDYPPLTAYHSWLCGLIGSLVDPSWFELDESRGIETAQSKTFMRSTVLVSDVFVYIPALIFFVRAWHGSRSKRTQSLALLCLLFQPSLILIDSGHFQYNSVMLGLTLLALDFFSQGRDELGSVFFVASLAFKQMALYYAPAIGSYLLGRCLSLGPKAGPRLFIRLAVVTIASFTLAFLPFLPPFASFADILNPISRIFPFARGLFEDKVANFWCASNVLFKWRLWFSQQLLIKLSAIFTALGFLPSVMNLVMSGWGAMNSNLTSVPVKKNEETITTPTLPILPWAMLSSSMSFFLFSFQVHEKTILLPLLPLNLLLSGAPNDSFTFEWSVLVNNVAVFSMWPLLKKDGLGIPYLALTFFWNYIIGYNPFGKPTPKHVLRYISISVYTLMFLIHIAELFISPPRRYPDLFPVLNVLVSTPIFFVTWLWSIKRSAEVTWGIAGVHAQSSREI
ncbi:hypothetical protein M0805_002006 [Coniferiporia weirii]|nr:hypothetical protein M0805_002006 [Coniferiporia weirii]